MRPFLTTNVAIHVLQIDSVTGLLFGVAGPLGVTLPEVEFVILVERRANLEFGPRDDRDGRTLLIHTELYVNTRTSRTCRFTE